MNRSYRSVNLCGWKGKKWDSTRVRISTRFLHFFFSLRLCLSSFRRGTLPVLICWFQRMKNVKQGIHLSLGRAFPSSHFRDHNIPPYTGQCPPWTALPSTTLIYNGDIRLFSYRLLFHIPLQVCIDANYRKASFSAVSMTRPIFAGVRLFREIFLWFPCNDSGK